MGDEKKDQVRDLPEKKIEEDKAEQVKGGGGGHKVPKKTV